jgi:hypothetical protein
MHFFTSGTTRLFLGFLLLFSLFVNSYAQQGGPAAATVSPLSASENDLAAKITVDTL